MSTAKEQYYNFGAIHLTFPGWDPTILRALTVKQRRYWAKWALARFERVNA